MNRNKMRLERKKKCVKLIWGKQIERATITLLVGQLILFGGLCVLQFGGVELFDARNQALLCLFGGHVCVG